jgi:hypothetical protein
MNNLFIASTPRHWLLSVYLTKKHWCQKPSVLFLDPQFPKDSIYLQLSEKYFDHVVQLPAGGSKQKLKTIKRIFNQFAVDNVISGSIVDPFIQYASHLLHKSTGGTFYLLDDGLSSYHPTNHAKLSRFEVFNRKLRFGFWYQAPVGHNLASPWVDEAFLLRPDAVKPTVNKKITAPDPNWYQVLPEEDLVQFFEAFHVDYNVVKKLEVAIILGLFKDGSAHHPKYAEDVLELLHYLNEKGIKFAVKYHPREKLVDPLTIKETFPKQLVLPGTLPFEVLISALNIKALLGDVSTVLLEMKKLDVDMNVYASMRGSAYDAPRSFLENAGVRVLNCFTEYKFFDEAKTLK